MNIRKLQAIDMHLDSLVWYSCYVDCLTRVLTEFIENGDSNLKPTDMPNLMELLAKFTHRMHKKLMQMKTDWEFIE